MGPRVKTEKIWKCKSSFFYQRGGQASDPLGRVAAASKWGGGESLPQASTIVLPKRPLYHFVSSNERTLVLEGQEKAGGWPCNRQVKMPGGCLSEPTLSSATRSPTKTTLPFSLGLDERQATLFEAKVVFFYVSLFYECLLEKKTISFDF